MNAEGQKLSEPMSQARSQSPASLRKAFLGNGDSQEGPQQQHPPQQSANLRLKSLTGDLQKCMDESQDHDRTRNSATPAWTLTRAGRLFPRPSSAPAWRAQRQRETREFHERQFECNRALANRRSLSIAQREHIAKTLEPSNRLFDGGKGREGFCAFLKKRFGTVLAGWRYMDKACGCRGYISKAEFCALCHSLGFGGQLQSIWQEMDHEQEGFITLLGLSPAVCNLVQSLKEAFEGEYGSVLAGWQKCIDPLCKGFVTEGEFVESCRRLQKRMQQRQLDLKIDPHRLWGVLVKGGTHKLTLAQFEPRAWEKICVGDIKYAKRLEPKTWDRLSTRFNSKVPYAQIQAAMQLTFAAFNEKRGT
eukprot:TRINITY_DN103375_c0_g1_i1.p1 TRINITY_DN103375_c0_g1~~TRINITY_DN103375_c0_g1_i1.p1  ORF type:complete len:362 (+),score=60.16 TRINITY_DN103375_c0_g1_i1:182-1267(+)